MKRSLPQRSRESARVFVKNFLSLFVNINRLKNQELKMDKFLYKDLTETIIEIFIEVHRELGLIINFNEVYLKDCIRRLVLQKPLRPLAVSNEVGG
jgi:hypothetical protein